mmetsp:Transcript_22407/g.88723  ORF Transcript_22407/g.88723 Transcript_22407/m.88723 type:complete len:622 (+) Transcript_22407:835-2700(+)
MPAAMQGGRPSPAVTQAAGPVLGAGSVAEDDLALLADPALEAGRVGLLDAVALDLEGRRDEAVVHGPGGLDQHQRVELLVRVQPRIDVVQVLGQLGHQCGALGLGAGALDALGRQHRDAKRLAHVGAGHAAGLDIGVHAQAVLDGRRGDVFALARLEQVLHAAGDANAAVGVHAGLVAGAQPAVFGEAVARLLRRLEVAQHHGRAAHLQLAGGRFDAHLHALVGRAHGAALVLARQRQMRQRQVLGHAIALVDVQAQGRIPLQQRHRHRRGAAGGELAFVQPQGLEHLLAHQAADDGQAQQLVELVLRHLGLDALLELHPQARHREEHRWQRALQVGREGVERLGEEDLDATRQPAMLHQRALHDVGQRQVGQHAVRARDRDALQARVHRPGKGAEAVHHALGQAGRAGGVDEGAELVGAAGQLALQRLGAGADGVPALVGRSRVVGRQGIARAGQAGRHAGLHALPAVELADEDEARFAVFQDLRDRLGRQRRVQRYGDITGHPDGQVAHQPPGAVLGQDGHLGIGGPALGLALGFQEGGHASHLVGHLAPAELLQLATAHGLRQRHGGARSALPVVEALQGEAVGGDGGHAEVSNEILFGKRKLTVCKDCAATGKHPEP